MFALIAGKVIMVQSSCKCGKTIVAGTICKFCKEEVTQMILVSEVSLANLTKDNPFENTSVVTEIEPTVC